MVHAASCRRGRLYCGCCCTGCQYYRFTIYLRYSDQKDPSSSYDLKRSDLAKKEQIRREMVKGGLMKWTASFTAGKATLNASRVQMSTFYFHLVPLLYFLSFLYTNSIPFCILRRYTPDSWCKINNGITRRWAVDTSVLRAFFPVRRVRSIR